LSKRNINTTCYINFKNFWLKKHRRITMNMDEKLEEVMEVSFDAAWSAREVSMAAWSAYLEAGSAAESAADWAVDSAESEAAELKEKKKQVEMIKEML
jgi:hypothetical protein